MTLTVNKRVLNSTPSYVIVMFHCGDGVFTETSSHTHIHTSKGSGNLKKSPLIICSCNLTKC